MTKEEIEQLAVSVSARLMAVTKNVLNFDEVMLLTGLSKSHLYKLTSANLIPYYKPNGKLMYFNRAEIEDWMQKNRNTTKSEIEEKVEKHLNNN